MHYGDFTFPVQERAQHSHPLGSFLSNLIDLRQPDEPCICGHPQITRYFDTLDWLPEKLYWSWMMKRCTILAGGKCFIVLFGVPFGHGALPTFRFRMAS